MTQTAFDSDKALTVLLYLAMELPEQGNVYKVLKVIYRANKNHLEKYGREIFNEQYQALAFGAVPALAYDIITHVRDGKPQPRMPKGVNRAINVSGDDTITPLIEPNMRSLSETDIECLNEAIGFYRKMSFEEVKNNAHEDGAYKDTPRDNYIPLERIIRTFPDGELLLKHIKAT